MHAPAPAIAAQRHRAGLFYGLGAYLLWGVMPLYFKALAHVSPGEILGHRILWSLVLLGGLVIALRRWSQLRAAFADRRILLTLLLTSALVAVNWLVYIIAIVTGHVLEGSLGYYLNPLVSILLGVVLLGERLSRAQVAATFLAAAGVAVLAAGAGSGLWISITLALSFASYGFLRKVTPVEAIEGLSIETILLAPFALGWILWLDAQGIGGLSNWSTPTTLLLILGGAITAIPLLMFTAAARRLPLSTLGFLQYVAPSIQFMLAVLVFGETLTTAHIVCFAAIWSALAIFSLDGVWRSVTARRQATAEAAGLA
jgi:chloramphenicol-sensitive protein RarD